MYPAKKTFCKVTMLVIYLLLSATLSSRIYADVIYTYTGPIFDERYYGAQNIPYTNISGSFTVDTALPPTAESDLPLTPLVTSYDFTDGVNTWTNTNGSTASFLVWTLSDGSVAHWWIWFLIGTPDQGYAFASTYVVDRGMPGTVSPPYMADWTQVRPPAGDPTPGPMAQAVGQGGGWVVSVPEPSTMLLLGSGLLGLVGLKRKFKN